MDINDILNNLGLDLTNPETKRGAIEAIEAILQSRIPTEPGGQGGVGGGGGGGGGDVEIDPDLILPSKKHQDTQAAPENIDIEDKDHILDQIKHNNSENTNNTPDDNKRSDADSPEKADQQKDTSSEAQKEPDNGSNTNRDAAEDNPFDQENSEGKESDAEFDEEDLLDAAIKGKYADKKDDPKKEARKIKCERTLKAAEKALADAKAKKVSNALIHELEQAIAALEASTEAVAKNIKDLSDDEFNILINRVFDAIEAVGDSNLTFTTDEKRQLKAKEIKADLTSTTTQNELSAEDVAKIRAENQTIRARDAETNKYKMRDRKSFKGFQDFLNSLYRAVALQVHIDETQDDTWSAINRRHSGTSVIQPGKKINELPNKKIPVIDFYFDQSGSWNSKDITIGKKAVSKLADMEEAGQIKINVYYFADNVHTDAESARAEGTTLAWNEIVKNVITTKATNVIIMTDADMEYRWNGPAPLSYTVPGYVWYLWRDGENAPRLPRDLKGRGGTQQFSFSASDL